MIDTKPLKYFLYYFILFLIICFVGITNVFALEYETIGYFTDKSDVLVELSYETESQAPIYLESGQEYYTQFNVMYITLKNYSFEANRHYQVEMYFPQSTLTNANVYEVYDANNNSCLISYKYSIFVDDYPRFNFQCPNTTNSITVKVYNSSDSPITNLDYFKWNYSLLRYTNVSINSEAPDITDNIINNNNQNTDKIIDNNNQNTDKIINSNKETQDVIKDQFQECSDSLNLFNLNGTRVMSSTASVFGSADNFNVSGATNSWDMVYFYIGVIDYDIIYRYSSSSFLSESVYVNVTNSNDYSSPINLANDRVYVNSFTSSSQNISNYKGKHLWISLRGSYPDRYDSVNYTNFVISSVPVDKYYPYGKQICTNRIDETNNQLKEANETSKGILGKIKDLFNWLTNDDEADVSSASDVAGWLPPGPIDSIITLPLTMLTNINSSLNKTCSPLDVNLPYVNKSVQIPCVSTIFNQITGLNSFWSWVGLISSVLILYRYLIELYKYYDRLTTLQANFISDWGGV